MFCLHKFLLNYLLSFHVAVTRASCRDLYARGTRGSGSYSLSVTGNVFQVRNGSKTCLQETFLDIKLT